MKANPLEVYLRAYYTGGISLLSWVSALAKAVNLETNHVVFDLDRSRMVIVCAIAAHFIVVPLGIVVAVFDVVPAWALLTVLFIPATVYVGAVLYVFYRIAVGIREVEIAQGKPDLVHPWLAALLVFGYFAVPYLQVHVNRISWIGSDRRISPSEGDSAVRTGRKGPVPSSVRSKWPYFVGAGFIIFGAVGATLFALVSLGSVMPKIQLVVPGTHEVMLEEPGGYTIFHEYYSKVDSRVFTTDQSLPEVFVTLRPKDSQAAVALSRATDVKSYQTGPRSGTSVLEFNIQEPGVYILDAQYGAGFNGPDIVLAIGKYRFWRFAAGFFGPGIGGLVMGATIIVVTLVRRGRANRDSQ